MKENNIFPDNRRAASKDDSSPDQIFQINNLSRFLMEETATGSSQSIINDTMRRDKACLVSTQSLNKTFKVHCCTL